MYHPPESLGGICYAWEYSNTCSTTRTVYQDSNGVSGASISIISFDYDGDLTYSRRLIPLILFSEANESNYCYLAVYDCEPWKERSINKHDGNDMFASMISTR
jgi:hypothetical protein